MSEQRPTAGPAPVDLQVEHYLITYSRGPGWVEGRSLFEQPLEDHAAYQAGLAERGLLLLSGPLLDREGGISIVKAADRAKADEIVAADPAVTSGVFVADIAPLFLAFSVLSQAGAPTPG
jgi:uncharacterized protein YciI